MLKKRLMLAMVPFLMFSFSEAYGADSERDEKFVERYEKFIPFDYSPGLESEQVTIGEIVAVDKEAKRVTIRADSETYHYKVMEDTSIWLDRTQLKESNLRGSLSDLGAGLKAEIQTASEGDEKVAKWIKVKINE